jgi:NitT/TauT family transport system substrate-binding protein
MFGRSSHIIFIVWLLPLLGLLAACNPTAAAQGPDQVTVQLSWFHNNEFAGFYAADQQGFYTAENLAVTLQPGGPEVDPVAAVLAGSAQFGVVTGDALVRARAAGQDLVAIASIFRDNPLVVMSLAGKGLRRPHNLVGQRVGVLSPNLDTPWDLQFLAMLKAANIDPSRLNFVPIEDYHGANDLVAGRVGACSGFFSTNEAIQARLDGYETDLIFYSDYGIVVYPNPIFTSGPLLGQQPGLVERFVRATLKGYQYAIEHPDEAAQFALKYDGTLDLALQAASMHAQIPFIDTGDAPIGWMDEVVWQDTLAILQEQGLIAGPVDLTSLYTNKFVELAQQ